MSRRRCAASFFAVAFVLGVLSVAAAPEGGLSSIKGGDLKEWLTYIASDELQGRAVYTTGIGLIPENINIGPSASSALA